MRSAPIDPYLVWHDSINFRTHGLLRDEKLVVQIELETPLGSQLDGVSGIEIPPIYQVPLGASRSTSRFLTARLPVTSIWQLITLPGVVRAQLELARLAKLAKPVHKVGEPSPGRERLAPGWRRAPPRTWLGVIDEGCPLAHKHYRDNSGSSRVCLLWDPSTPRPGAITALPPKHLGYGREWRPARAGPILDQQEEARYADFDLADFPNKRFTHGCGVLDLFGGHPDPIPAQFDVAAAGVDEAGALPIACVLLPPDDLDQGCRTGFGARVLDALRYLIDGVERYEQPDGARNPGVRLVVNLSYGSLAGPHDGSSILESAMDELLLKRGNLAIVLAAGNTVDEERPTHALMVDKGRMRQRRLSWRIQPDDRTDSFVEIWFSARVDLRTVTLYVTPPFGTRQAVRVGDAVGLSVLGTTVAGLIFPHRCSNGRDGTMALLALVGSDPIDGKPGAPGGVWSIELEHTGTSGTVHAWIERDDLVPGQGRKRQQSWFEGLDAKAQPTRYTLSSIAHGRHTVVVGGMHLSDGSVPRYSASGPSRSASGRKHPDITAPSDRSPAVPGLRVAGTLSGITHAFSGTSAAAPVAARWLANWFASQPIGRIGVTKLRGLLTSRQDATLRPGGDPLRLSRVSFGPNGQPPEEQR